MIVNALLLFVPLSLLLQYVVHAGPAWIFATAILAIVPLAEWIRRATEHVAAIAGPAIGGLLNVSFGNAAELIIAVFVLIAGQQNVVKAQITGSMIGNSLLGLGLAIVAGSFGRESQRFRRERVGLLSSLLVLSVIAVMLPALFDYTERGLFKAPDPGLLDERLSLGVSIVLILVYAANLIYTLFTHRDIFAAEQCEDDRSRGGGGAAGGGRGASAGSRWPAWVALAVLIGATVLTALEAELVSGTVEATAGRLGLTPFFLGVIVLAVVGNAAEYISAVYFARQDRMGLVMSITVGSTIQVALLLAPLLVIISFLIGRPMNLVFVNPLELIAVAAAAFAVNSIAQDGETTWFEGVLLVAVYVLLALAFYFVTP